MDEFIVHKSVQGGRSTTDCKQREIPDVHSRIWTSGCTAILNEPILNQESGDGIWNYTQKVQVQPEGSNLEG